MPKNMPIARLNSRDRGLRRPRQESAIRGVKRRLYPFMSQPVLPGESLAGGIMRGRNMFSRMVQPHNAPMSWSEVALWYVPLSAYPNWMIDSIVAGAEDLPLAPSADALGAQGLKTVGLQNRDREWAGEIGDGVGGVSNGSRASAYMPWVSEGVYRIAAHWYENEFNDVTSVVGWTDDDLSSGPPIIGSLVKGALPAGITPEVNDLDATINPSLTTGALNQSISDWAQRLTVLQRPDMTYADYLASHGINPKSVGGIAQPITYRMIPNRAILGGMNAASGVTTQDPIASVDGYGTGQAGTESGHRLVVTQGGATQDEFSIDAAGVAPHGSEFSLRVPSGMFFDEPGFIIGTWVWYETEMTLGHYAEHLTATRMRQFPTGGVGGYDEIEFLKAQIVEYIQTEGGDPVDSGTIQPDDGGTGARAFNLLNLFLYGDTFSNAVQAQPFQWRGSFGSLIPDPLQEFYCQIDGELGILSHLVNAS